MDSLQKRQKMLEGIRRTKEDRETAQAVQAAKSAVAKVSADRGKELLIV